MAIEYRAVDTRTGYDIWSEIYDNEDNPLILLEELYFDDVVGDVCGRALADLGCGTGRQSLRQAARGANVTALDFSEGMLTRARQRPGADKIRWLQHDLHVRLPLTDGAFERVISCLVLEHVNDLAALFRECRRICAPEGVIAISAMHPAMMLRGITARFTDPATGAETRPHSHGHSISDFLMAAKSAGLRLEHISEHAVDEALAAHSPRSEKYLGWQMLLLLRFASSVEA